MDSIKYGALATVPLNTDVLEIECRGCPTGNDRCEKCRGTGFVGAPEAYRAPTVADKFGVWSYTGPGRVDSVRGAEDELEFLDCFVTAEIEANEVLLAGCLTCAHVTASDVTVMRGSAELAGDWCGLHVEDSDVVVDGAVTRCCFDRSRVSSAYQGLVAKRQGFVSATDCDLVHLTLSRFLVDFARLRRCRFESVELIDCHVVGDVPDGVTLTRCTREPRLAKSAQGAA